MNNLNPEIGLTKDVSIIPPEKIQTILEPGEVGIMLDWEVRDTKTGELMPDPRTGLPNKGIKRCESFVRGFLEVLYLQVNGIRATNAYSIRDITNTLRSCRNAGDGFNANAGAGTTSNGIIVGTSAVAPTINDYVIGAIINHGVGGGQLQYGAVTFGAPASDATTSQLTITRNFANGSGAGITVAECSLYVTANYGAEPGGTLGNFMGIRDVTGGILVPNGQTLTLNYRLQATI